MVESYGITTVPGQMGATFQAFSNIIALEYEGLARFLASSGGLPRLDAKSTKDKAVRLLRIAAEIEHALLVDSR